MLALNQIAPYWPTAEYVVIITGSGDDLDLVSQYLPEGLCVTHEIHWGDGVFSAKVIFDKDKIPVMEEWLTLMKLTT